MKLQTKIRLPQGKSSPAFSLIELMISVVISVIVVASIATLSLVTAQNFTATSNYVQMNDQNRLALDRISREIRNASALIAFNQNGGGNGNPLYLQFTNQTSGTTTKITYKKSTKALTLDVTGQPTETLLTGCNEFGFEFFNRAPLIITNTSTNNLTFYIAANPLTDCKVINLNWKCSRTIVGSKLNTEVVQTAQVMLRNKVD